MANKNEMIESVFLYYLQLFSVAQSIDIAWFGNEYNPEIGKDYISEQFIPNDPQTVLVGRTNTQRRRGIYQLRVNSSNVNEAIAKINQFTELLNAIFSVGYPISYNGVYVQIENFADRQIEFDDGWYSKAISLYYRADL